MAMTAQEHIHRLFVVTLVLKGIHAFAELVGSVSLYLIGTDAIVRWLYGTGARGGDPLAPLFAQFARTFSASEHRFYAFYLATHGAVNLVLVVALLRRKRWAYPTTFVILSGFIALQLHRYAATHDIGLIALSIVDLMIIALTWNEYASRRT
jgi:uncharacterized membrane protein